MSTVHRFHKCSHAAVAAGADAAIGFEESIDCEIANDWTEYFFVHYTSPDSSGASAYYASQRCNHAGNIDSYIVIKQP